jgi:hypothetical protein
MFVLYAGNVNNRLSPGYGLVKDISASSRFSATLSIPPDLRSPSRKGLHKERKNAECNIRDPN